MVSPRAPQKEHNACCATWTHELWMLWLLWMTVQRTLALDTAQQAEGRVIVGYSQLVVDYHNQET